MLGVIDDDISLHFEEQQFIDEKPSHYSFSNNTKLITKARMMDNYLTQFDDIFARLSGYLTISITDISNRNIGFILRGSEVQKYINSGCPLDLDLKSFPVGESSRTVFESVSILLFRESETSFRVECWRSFSSYLTNFFERIAKTND